MSTGTALHGPPSLSKSALLLSPCIRWAGPQAEHYDQVYVDGDELSKRDKGTLFHKLIHNWSVNRFMTGLKFSGLEDVDRWLEHARKFYADELWHRFETVQTESAIAINWASGEVRHEPAPGAWADRNYPNLGVDWQFGTADLVAVLKTGELLVADWKTGGSEGATEQLLSLACGFQNSTPVTVWESLGHETVRPVRIACLQVNDDGVWPHEQEVSQERLKSHWDSMRFAFDDVGKNNEPKPGIHCTQLYCPHLAYCPAITDANVDLGAAVKPAWAVKHGIPMAITGRPAGDKEAGESMALLSAAKRQAKYIEAQMKEYVEKGGRVVDGEWEWGPGSNGYRWRRQGPVEP